jgi:hypothetical protein
MLFEEIGYKTIKTIVENFRQNFSFVIICEKLLDIIEKNIQEFEK